MKKPNDGKNGSVIERANGAEVRRVVAYLPPELHADLRRVAAATDSDVSTTVGAAVRQHVAAHAAPPAAPAAAAQEVGLRDGRVLLCPRCDEGYLHQADVTVFQRRVEDGDGFVTEVTNDGVSRVAAKSTALPGRRDALVIGFFCEWCDEDGPGIGLEIMQHKGSTLVRWVAAPRAGRQ